MRQTGVGKCPLAMNLGHIGGIGEGKVFGPKEMFAAIAHV